MAAGKLIAARAALPPPVRFVTGAAAYSLSVFLLLACHAGYIAVYVLWGAVLAAAAWQRARSTQPLAPLSWFYRPLFAAYGAMYFIVALAPEIQEDAAGYHLRIVSDYVRLHGFSDRVSFYDVFPHGLEMLFVPAFAMGAHSAAKLVHFAFLAALVPLVREIALELGMTKGAGTAAAALLFLAPVCGVAGTSAYTDLGLVCACCAALYLLIRWDRESDWAFLLCAGLNAGFCYAIKPAFGWIVIPGLVFIAAKSRRGAALFVSAALLSVIPWVLRAWFLTRNPFAPFLNAWFPNAASLPAVERHLFAMYNAFRPGFSWWRAWPAFTITGGNQGLLGPAFLLLPLTLLALYRKRGRWLMACSLLLAIPFLADTGTRFLLPALVPATLALASLLPGPVLVAAVAVQAIGSLPPVLELYDSPGEWRIRDVPLKAALRMVPEREYLRRTLPGISVGGMLVRNTSAEAKIFVCTALPESYIARELLFFWQSSLANRITGALHFASISHGTPAQLLTLRWERNRYLSLRMTADSELTIVEGPAHRWLPVAEGQTLDVPLNQPRTGADLLIWPTLAGGAKMEALSPSGAWQKARPSIDESQCCLDLRRDATAWMRRAGYRYLLISVAGDAFAEIGMDMARHPDAWGVNGVDRSGDFWLFYISPAMF